MINKIFNEDCLIGMQRIPDKSIDMILCDLPYGTTACKWDNVIPFEPLWAQYNRVIKDNGAIVLFGSQPFTSALVMSNPKMFRYNWVWKKRKAGNFQLAKKQPLRITEDILVFSVKPHLYYPIPSEISESTKSRYKYKGGGKVSKLEHMSSGEYEHQYNFGKEFGYPKNILDFGQEVNSLHPTQKPVPLLEYLIKTYTDEGETVLDNTCGSGSTCVAAINTNRNYIGFELDKGYFDIAQKRIQDAQTLFSQQL